MTNHDLTIDECISRLRGRIAQGRKLLKETEEMLDELEEFTGKIKAQMLALDRLIEERGKEVMKTE